MSSQPQLPLELVSRIVQTAWTETSSGESRFDLYNALANAHPYLHAVVTEIATRNVILDLGPGPRPDLELYRDILCQLNDGSSKQERDRAFSHAHVRVDNCSYIDRHREGWPRMLSGSGSSQMGMLVAPLVGDCTSFTLNYNFVREAAWEYDSVMLSIAESSVPALSFLSAYSSLTSLHIHHRLPHLPASWADPTIPAPCFPALSTLHLWEFPRCGCKAYRPRREQYLGCFPGCLRTHFARIFPNIYRLHIETPVSLSTVDVTHWLKTLTVDAPPVPDEDDGPVCGSLSRWELGAALEGGFMRWEDGPAPREVVVRSFARDPDGWPEAVEVCTRYGLVLRRSYY